MKFALAFVCCLVMAGCATTPPIAPLTQNDDGRKITVSVGQVVAVQLPGNPTTGYSWTAQTVANPVLECVAGPTHIQNPAPTGMVGVGGVTMWQFKAVKAGSQTLRMEYARPWETNKSPEKVITYDVVVR